MNRIATIALSIAATFATSGTALVHAQDAAKATVPFNFSVGAAQMPAGTYTLGSASHDGTLIQVTDRDQKINMLALGRIEANNGTRNAVLVFHHYGDMYFLSEIRYPNSTTAVHFVPTRTERRAKKGILESGLHVDSNVLVALENTAGAQHVGQ